eukprot:2519121-Amphidinium_carterae.2
MYPLVAAFGGMSSEELVSNVNSRNLVAYVQTSNRCALSTWGSLPKHMPLPCHRAPNMFQTFLLLSLCGDASRKLGNSN